MAFIEKTDLSVLNIKLTTKGRELLSRGKLTFKKFALGDSEIDYNIINQKREYINNLTTPDDAVVNNLENFGKIIKPVDLNPDIISFIRRSEISSNTSNIPMMPTYKSTVINERDSIGYFSTSGETFFIKNDLVLGSGQISSISGNQITISGTSFENGSLLLVKKNNDNSIDINTPNEVLLFMIESANGSTYTLDRDFQLSGTWYGFNLKKMRGEDQHGHYPSDYVFENDGGTLFFDNITCDVARFPYWKLSILFTKNILGIDGYPDNENGVNKSYLEYNSTLESGFVKYIQNHKKIYDMLGVIHYTNPSPTNTYAEGLYKNTTEINIPTVMWHKPKDTETTYGNMKMGLKLIAYGDKKRLDGEILSLGISYYDLADEDGYVVGKIFTGLKIAVIEDQDLLFALSFKSNRNWTLPKPELTRGGVV